MNPVIQLKITTTLFVVASMLACLALLPRAQALVPAPDGGYPGGNTAEGQAALLSLTTGGFNTAVGLLSLRSDTTSSLNTAVGAGTLLANTADENTAIGAGALLSNTTGGGNTATGAFALFSNSGQAPAAGDNTATGDRALFSNTGGSGNTAMGGGALSSNTIGVANTALGVSAGSNLTTGNNNIDIGNFGVAGESNTIRIGGDIGLGPQAQTFIVAIRGITTVNNNAIPVLIDSAGQLGTASSSRRYKTDIKPIEKASESVLALKPVSFRYKVHKDRTPQFGLIAEEVAQVNPDLVIYDADGKPYTVRYDAVNAMLLNEFLKAHRKMEAQEAKIARQQKQIESLNAGLEKVSAQLEASKPALQTARLPAIALREGGNDQ